MHRFLSAFALFAACAAASRFLPAGGQPALKLLLILAALVLVRGQWAAHGFVWPARTRRGTVVAPGLLLGALSSLGALLFDFDGMRHMLKGYSLPQIILVIWFWSSLSEEIYCRGWFQSSLPPGPSRVIWSAALFGSMHTSLFRAGDDIPSVLWIVLSTTALGYTCAAVREFSGSWIPAFVPHPAFNAGGLVGGIVYAIGYRIATGQMPPS